MQPNVIGGDAKGCATAAALPSKTPKVGGTALPLNHWTRLQAITYTLRTKGWSEACFSHHWKPVGAGYAFARDPNRRVSSGWENVTGYHGGRVLLPSSTTTTDDKNEGAGCIEGIGGPTGQKTPTHRSAARLSVSKLAQRWHCVTRWQLGFDDNHDSNTVRRNRPQY